MVKFKQDYYVDLTDRYGFTFREGYSYMSYNVDDGVEATSIDGNVRVRLDVEEMRKYLEE